MEIQTPHRHAPSGTYYRPGCALCQAQARLYARRRRWEAGARPLRTEYLGFQRPPSDYQMRCDWLNTYKADQGCDRCGYAYKGNRLLLIGEDGKRFPLDKLLIRFETLVDMILQHRVVCERCWRIEKDRA